MEDLVLANPTDVARESYAITAWLIDVRAAAHAVGLEAAAAWQRIVDALVVAGVAKLAPYSQ